MAVPPCPLSHGISVVIDKAKSGGKFTPYLIMKGGGMIFNAHTAFALGLIALVAGTYLLARGGKEDMCCKAFAKIIGTVVVILSILCVLCTGFYSFRYLEEGYFLSPHPKWERGMEMKGKGMRSPRRRAPRRK